MGTSTAAASSVGIDWANILNGASMTPDVTIPGGSWPSSSTFSTSWPVIFVDQASDYSLVVIVRCSRAGAHRTGVATALGDDAQRRSL
jgi:hypothetical protein